MKIKKNKLGFTLIELLIVIAIIGILATVILVMLSGARKSAKEAAAIRTIGSLFKALAVCTQTTNYTETLHSTYWAYTNHASLDGTYFGTPCTANNCYTFIAGQPIPSCPDMLWPSFPAPWDSFIDVTWGSISGKITYVLGVRDGAGNQLICDTGGQASVPFGTHTCRKMKYSP